MNKDVVENIVVLSSYCHSILHHGNKLDKIQILGAIYYKHIEGLREVGLDITLDKLFELYGIK